MSGSGLNFSIVWSPLVPVAAIVALAVFAGMVVALGFLRRTRGTWLRLAGFVFLLAVLAGPRWLVRTTTPLPDTVLVVRDRSPSMAIGHRFRMVDAAFHHLVATLPRGLQLKTVEVGGKGDDGTPLFAALKAGRETIPPGQLAGIVALTDGEATDAPGALPSGVPVSVLIPARDNQTDRALTLLAAPRYGLVGHHVTLRFVVRDHGVDDAGVPVPVRISIDGRIVRTVDAPVGQTMSVDLTVAHAGTAIVAVAADPLKGEVSVANDQAVFSLDGVRRRLTVLLIAGRPSPGLRAWRLLLKSDPAVRLVNFTILRLPTEPMPASVRDMALIPFPVDQLFNRDLGKFDLIILDQFANDDLLLPPYLANITRHIRAGGALLMETGPEFEGNRSLAYSPLAPILPVRPFGEGTVTGQFTPTLTTNGKSHPVTAPLAQDHLGSWYRYETVETLSGTTLLSTPGPDAAPLLILAHAGKGRVAMLMSDQFWLWARGALAHDGKMAGPAQSLLRRTVHWLLGEPSLAARQLDASIAHGELSIRRIAPHGPPGSATVTSPDGTKTQVKLRRTGPGNYVARMPADGAGVWHIEADGLAAYAGAANDDPLEQADLAASDRIFAPLARRDGGRIIWLARGGEPEWSGLYRRRHASLVTGARDVPLPPAIPGAFIGLALLAAAWWRERG